MNEGQDLKITKKVVGIVGCIPGNECIYDGKKFFKTVDEGIGVEAATLWGMDQENAQIEATAVHGTSPSYKKSKK